MLCHLVPVARTFSPCSDLALCIYAWGDRKPGLSHVIIFCATKTKLWEIPGSVVETLVSYIGFVGHEVHLGSSTALLNGVLSGNLFMSGICG